MEWLFSTPPLPCLARVGEDHRWAPHELALAFVHAVAADLALGPDVDVRPVEHHPRVVPGAGG